MSEVKLNPNCPCLTFDCPYHGKCDECRNYHHPYGEKTYCEIQAEENKRFTFAKNKPLI